MKKIAKKKVSTKSKPKQKRKLSQAPTSLPSQTKRSRTRVAHHRRRLSRSFRHELANLVSHGIGAGMAIAGTIFLILKGMEDSYSLKIFSFILYGSSITILYLASTFYHALPSPNAKKIFRRIDHASIFLAIAGSYSPITLVSLNGSLGWLLFGIVWLLAIAGIFYKSFFINGREYISLSLYILMGWMIVFAIKPMLSAMEPAGLWLLVAGGLSYTFGTIFYSMERMPYHHLVWHLFVMAGSIFHFIAIYNYVK
ncbi:PAQR family membrane homeostasis protein TrhA [Leptospira sp. GIMC2001]|uniref:PAQR family membrane homeostasis protein TrhA n=1 Tax=Leptospira sp. GIMC2001 TaxID=1513297 RepID=UPI0023499255|nr:hemolysin III family protein [Leptospira sp. GIMC2001]WCL49108.1 hemolysin III family protein [Leptospira sp. GIMC2001]